MVGTAVRWPTRCSSLTAGAWPCFLQDLLCWRGYALYDCTAEFRTFWLQTKFAEEGLAQEDAESPDQLTGAASWLWLATAKHVLKHSRVAPHIVSAYEFPPCFLRTALPGPSPPVQAQFRDSSRR